MAESTSSSVSQGADRARIRRLERELAETKSRHEAEIASNQSKLDEIERCEVEIQNLIAVKDRALGDLDVALVNHSKASGNHRDGDEHKQLQAKIAELEKAQKADVNEIHTLREQNAMLEDRVSSLVNDAIQYQKTIDLNDAFFESEFKSSFQYMWEKRNSLGKEETKYLNGLRSGYSTEVASRAPSGGARPSEISLTVGSNVEAEKQDTALPGKASEEGFTTPAKVSAEAPPAAKPLEPKSPAELEMNRLKNRQTLYRLPHS